LVWALTGWVRRLEMSQVMSDTSGLDERRNGMDYTVQPVFGRVGSVGLGDMLERVG